MNKGALLGIYIFPICEKKYKIPLIFWSSGDIIHI